MAAKQLKNFGGRAVQSVRPSQKPSPAKTILPKGVTQFKPYNPWAKETPPTEEEYKKFLDLAGQQSNVNEWGAQRIIPTLEEYMKIPEWSKRRAFWDKNLGMNWEPERNRRTRMTAEARERGAYIRDISLAGYVPDKSSLASDEEFIMGWGPDPSGKTGGLRYQPIGVRKGSSGGGYSGVRPSVPEEERKKEEEIKPRKPVKLPKRKTSW